MADSKVSELTAATSVGGSDTLYLVQSSTSKKVTVAKFFENAANVTLSGNINIGGTVQSLAAPGLISLTTPITHLTSDASGGALAINQGTSGQTKYLVMIGDGGGNYTLSANVAGSGTITFDTIGDTAQLLFTSGKWYMVGGTANVTY